MLGVFVVLVPIFIAGFALLMDRFESRILREPQKVESPRSEVEADGATPAAAPGA